MKHLKTISLSLCSALLLTALVAVPALAHDGPEGAEWVMADWIFITFAVFAGGALIAFVAALKAGLLSNIEDAKYQILTIDEPDYYSADS
jgi:hypothetical protein